LKILLVRDFHETKSPRKNFSVSLPWRTCNKIHQNWMSINVCMLTLCHYFFGGGTVVEIQDLTIAVKALYHLCHSGSPCCAKNFQTSLEKYLSMPDLNHDPPVLYLLSRCKPSSQPLNHSRLPWSTKRNLFWRSSNEKEKYKQERV
jgi:hypothetical protein